MGCSRCVRLGRTTKTLGKKDLDNSIKQWQQELVRRYPYAQHEQQNTDTTSPDATKKLGLLELCALGIGAVVGTGVFVLTGQVAALYAGPAVAISYLLAAIAALGSGLCYAEMAGMLPVSGSAYRYAYIAVGQWCAFLLGCVLILEFAASACMVCVGWSSYVQALFHISLKWGFVDLGAALICLAMTLLLSFGIQALMRWMKVIVLIKLVVIGVFLGVCAPFVQVNYWTPFLPANQGQFGHFGWSGVFQAATILFFAYGGFDAIATAAADAKRPQRDVPLAMFWSIGIAACLYIAIALVLTGIVPFSALNIAHPLVKGLDSVGYIVLAKWIDIGALLGLTAVLLVQIYSLLQIISTMMADGLMGMPPTPTPTNAQNTIPKKQLWIIGFILTLIASILPMEKSSAWGSITILTAFTMMSGMLIYCRFQYPHWRRGFKVPGPWWGIPLLSTLVTGLLLSTAPRQALQELSVLLGACFAAYLSYHWYSCISKRIK
jgi:APA family basic amino acid/polyamine antiporter